MIGKEKEHQKEILESFHHLWIKAIGTKDYDKKEWMALEKALIDLCEQLNEYRRKISKKS